MKKLAACLLILCCSVGATASDETYLDGDTLYKKEKVWYQYYQPCYGWKWASYYDYKKIASARDEDFHAVLAKYAGQIRLASDRHQAFLESVNALGLGGSGASIYGARAYPTVAQGQTIYGYSTVADFYGIDLNALYQQASRLTQNAQTLAGQAHTDFSDVIKQEGLNRARIAEIIAKGQAAAQAAKAVEASPSIRVESREFRFRVDSEGKVSAEPVAVALNVVNSKCAGCHSGEKKQGGFDVTTFSKLDGEGKRKVWERLLTPDAAKRMPKDGPVLTVEELKAFFQ